MNARWSRSKKTWALAGAALLVGCTGYALHAEAITTTSAQLMASFSCAGASASNPCTGWVQYWKDGASTVTSAPAISGNVTYSGTAEFTVSGLVSNTVYHYEFCGYGDTNLQPPGACTGSFENGNPVSLNLPGTQPSNLTSDFSSTSTFRTAGSGTVGTADLGRVVSSADTSSTPITRDSGFSVQYSTSPSKALWLFDDTMQSGTSIFIGSGTAAEGPFTAGAAPQQLVELPTPGTAPGSPPTSPAPFHPSPTGLVRHDNGKACGTTNGYAAAWNMGAVKEPSSPYVLVVYGELCIEGDPLPDGGTTSVITLERIVVTEYDPVANAIHSTARPFVSSPLGAGLAPNVNIGAPIFPGDGFVYYYVGDFSFAGSAIYVVRASATPSTWGTAANYKWWAGGTTWGGVSGAVSVIPNPVPVGGSVNVADYSSVSSHKYVLVEQTNFGGVLPFSLYYATSPTGPWTLGPSAIVPEAHCTGGPLAQCYAIKGHPELSTSTSFTYSWYSPDDRGGFGHLRLGTLDW